MWTRAPAGARNTTAQHQTRCQEFVGAPKCRLLQPDLDYMAPEMLRAAKCSHKSDLFSFGLILGQAYDSCRHRAPLSCKASVQGYESELKKVSRPAGHTGAGTRTGTIVAPPGRAFKCCVRAANCPHPRALTPGPVELTVEQTDNKSRSPRTLTSTHQTDRPAANFDNPEKRHNSAVQLDRRRKMQLARLVPCELRALLVEMLDNEPNLRPSANRVLQVSVALLFALHWPPAALDSPLTRTETWPGPARPDETLAGAPLGTRLPAFSSSSGP